ncbi:MAG: UDP-3-O-acyl-N-acetylglucosamine deacetylase [Phycisphaerales bacterium]|nr:UDP-3-O-acyl-N-acetylglucosamine deacetylase [Phycisphaerales bacterium]
MIPRRTVAGVARVEGFGLFTDAAARVEIQPAEAGSGIVIRRGPAHAVATIERLTTRPAHPAFASMNARCTGVDLSDGSPAFTIEHILSALAGLGITDALLALEGPEVPIIDGSALPFIHAIERVGTRHLPAGAHLPALDGPTVVGDPNGVRVEIHPAQALSMHFHLEYGPGSPIPRQSAHWDGSPVHYREHIAPARTYCLLHEAEAMRQLGLFARLTPSDFVVFGPSGPIDNTLRWNDEPARHKLLDLIGDLALAGLPFPAMRVEAFGSGHALHHQAARALRAVAGRAGTV